MKQLSKIVAKAKSNSIVRKLFFIENVSLIIILILAPIIMSHNRVGRVDWDIFFAYHEALRQVILAHHQFPWWNPWMYGGVPLFANPQLGLLSIETPFILVFGTIWGMKLAAVAYFVAGFWGMYWLLKALKTPKLNRLLLSYLWIFSTFVTFHFYVGHYTFLLYLLSPWLFFLALKLEDGWRWAIIFGLFIGFFINSNLHYMTVQAMLILGFWLIIQLFLAKDKKSFILRTLTALGIALVVALPKLYFADKYVSEFAVPGSGLIQQVTTLKVASRAFLYPFQKPFQATVGQLGWFEITAYIGLTAMILFIIASFRMSLKAYSKKRINLGVAFLLAALLCFIIGLGPFSGLSPYGLLRHLPVLEAMQVPSRWFGWAIFFVLLTIGQFKEMRKISCILLAIAAIELTITQPLRGTFPYPQPSAVTNNTGFQQYESFAQLSSYTDGKIMGSDMYQSTISNYGEINAYEPIINRAIFGQPKAGACGINVGCKLTSSNAQVTYWSPNDISLKRIGPGPITLNVNPSSYWLVNGKRLFSNDRVAEPNKKFIITDTSKEIEVKIMPL